MRRNRCIEVGTGYEIVVRAEHSIPFPPTRTTVEIVSGIFGRWGCQPGIRLTHAVFLSNHGHYMAYAEEEDALSLFCQNINKRLTESLKVLLGFEKLNLWEDRANIAQIPLLKDQKRKIVYIYSNPAAAGLVDSIDEFPGFSSWKAFLTCAPDVDAYVEENVRHYFKRALKRLPASNTLDSYEDLNYLTHLRAQEVRTGKVNIVSEEVLKIYPFAFLKQYGITDPAEIEAIREEIKQAVYAKEAQLRAERAAQEMPVIGVERLQRSPYMKPHTPKLKLPHISFICSDEELLSQKLAEQSATIKGAKALRAEAIDAAREGSPVTWPKGVYIPWLPPVGCGTRREGGDKPGRPKTPYPPFPKPAKAEATSVPRSTPSKPRKPSAADVSNPLDSPEGAAPKPAIIKRE
jgi:hypothetical protein